MKQNYFTVTLCIRPTRGYVLLLLGPRRKKGKGSPYSGRVPELMPVLGSQPAGDVSHKPGGRLPLLSARPAVTPATMGVNSLPKTVTRQRRGCDLNPGPSAPESSTLTTRLPSHPAVGGGH